MIDKELAILADALEAASEPIPRSIDAMKTGFAPEMNSTHPCCPQTRTTVGGCPKPPGPRPGTIVGCQPPPPR